MKNHQSDKDGATRGTQWLFGNFFENFNRLLNRGGEKYGNSLSILINHKVLVMIAYVTLLGLLVWLAKDVAGGFVPAQDKEYLIGFTQLDPGTSLERTDAVLHKLNSIALGQDGVAETSSHAGLSINGLTNFGLFLTPVFYVILRSISVENLRKTTKNIPDSLQTH